MNGGAGLEWTGEIRGVHSARAALEVHGSWEGNEGFEAFWQENEGLLEYLRCHLHSAHSCMESEPCLDSDPYLVSGKDCPNPNPQTVARGGLFPQQIQQAIHRVVHQSDIRKYTGRLTSFA